MTVIKQYNPATSAWETILIGETGPTGPQGGVGPAGATGSQGPQGSTGAASTVAGPQGPQGSQGPQGDTGDTGVEGIVTAATAPIDTSVLWADTTTTGAAGTVPSGGTIGQVLAKNSGTDYDTGWASVDVVELTDSTTSTSTTTAATANSISEALADVRDYLSSGSATAIDVFPRFTPVGVCGQTDGIAVVTYFTPTQNMTVTQITYVGAAASSGLTLARFGLYSETTLLARTASDTTLFNTANTVYTRSFDTAGGYPSSYNLIAGTRYAVGIIQVGGTLGQLRGAKSFAGILSLSPQIMGRITGQTDLPTATPNFTTNLPDVLFARLS